MGNTCTSQISTTQKKTPKKAISQPCIQIQHCETHEDFNFQILEPSLVASTYEYTLAEALKNPEKLVRPTNVGACFKHSNSQKTIPNLQEFFKKKQNLSTQSSDRSIKV